MYYEVRDDKGRLRFQSRERHDAVVFTKLAWDKRGEILLVVEVRS